MLPSLRRPAQCRSYRLISMRHRLPPSPSSRNRVRHPRALCSVHSRPPSARTACDEAAPSHAHASLARLRRARPPSRLCRVQAELDQKWPLPSDAHGARRAHAHA
eukprot:6193229-Pleurochrysis_carterae.AAC.3